MHFGVSGSKIVLTFSAKGSHDRLALPWICH